jgi:hypothetical protein
MALSDASPADICIYGGAAGGGKTVGLILEPLRHATRVANFTSVFFRRSTPQITNPGGLWDESQKFYPGSAAYRTLACVSGAGPAAAKSSSRTYSSTPRSTTGRARRSR